MTRPHPWAEGDSNRFFEASLETTFRQLLGRFQRRGRRAGAAAAGAGVIAARLARGGSVRLRTADRALRIMGEPALGPLFGRALEAYIDVTGIKAYLVGELALADPSFVTRFRNGSSPWLRTADRMLAWMGRHCPLARRRAIGAAALKGVAFGGLGEDERRRGPSCGVRTRHEDNALPWLLRTGQAAERLGLSPRTLERFRVAGGGPRYCKLGRAVRYSASDIEEWARGCVRSSTSDDGLASRPTRR